MHPHSLMHLCILKILLYSNIYSFNKKKKRKIDFVYAFSYHYAFNKQK